MTKEDAFIPPSYLRLPVPVFSQGYCPMALYLLQNLVPKGEKVERTKPLWEDLKDLTWTQWGLFFTG